MRVQIGDRVFETIKEAADAFGVNPKTIHGRLERGTLDGLLDDVKDGRKKRGKPVTIRGVTYPNYRTAELALGLAVGAVSHAAMRGGLDTIGLRKRAGGSQKATPVTVAGMAFASITDLCRFVGEPHSHVSWVLRAGKDKARARLEAKVRAKISEGVQ